MNRLESPQIQVLVNSVKDRGECHPCNAQHVQQRERTPLLGTSRWRSAFGSSRSKLRRACCVKTKAAHVILCWNALVTLLVWYPLEFGSFIALDDKYNIMGLENRNIKQLQFYGPLFFGSLAILYLFYPLAGCLADIKCGRYKTIIYSLCFITWGGVFACTGSIVMSAVYYHMISWSSAVPLVVAFGLPTLIGIIMYLTSYIAFSANIIQFGMDQLHDSPSEDSALFIHWFVFSSHVGLAIAKFVTLTAFGGLRLSKYADLPLLYLLPILTLTAIGVISSCVVKYKRQWFLIDTGSRNPYKLVYRVVKFAAQHKTPIRRSAFTYCEDELPSRMDLGKEKYGGPFTTEQVEDVKAFLGLLCLLLTLGPLFATDIAAESMLFKFSDHLNMILDTYWPHNNISHLIMILLVFFRSGGLTELLIVTLIPTYICLLRPFIHHYIPGMLKCIGLGMILMLCSLLCTFSIDTVGHIENSNNQSTCFIKLEYNYDPYPLDISVWYLVLPYILNGIGTIFLYVSLFEFICAQSPHAMKGLIIGTLFAVKGVFKFVGATLLLIPFLSWNSKHNFPSCGFVYYLINILIALTGLVVYTWIAKRYQYRQRDEPDNIYHYAEEYYDRD